MATNGKLERIIQIPTGDWTFTLSEEGANVGTVTLTAGNTYYWGSAGNNTVTFAARLKTQLEAIGAGTYTVALAAGESGTGKLTISVSGGAASFGIHTFKENGSANNALRSLLGFTADITVDVASATSQSAVQSCWLPDAPSFWPRGQADYGKYETDGSHTESGAGHVWAVYSQKKQALSLEWKGLTSGKVWKNQESVVGESWQQFWLDCVLGEKGFCTQPAGPIRWYPDADTDATYQTYKIPLFHDAGQLFHGRWAGFADLHIPRMVVVP